MDKKLKEIISRKERILGYLQCQFRVAKYELEKNTDPTMTKKFQDIVVDKGNEVADMLDNIKNLKKRG